MSKVVNITNFEDVETVDVEIEVRGKTQVYKVRELSAAEGQRIFSKLNKGTEQQKLDAAAKFPAELVSKCVSRENGEPITMEEAGNMRMTLSRKLQNAALEVNGLTDAVDELKNE